MDLAKQLSYNYVFRGLTQSAINGLAAIASVQTFRGGDTLIRQFDYNTDVMVILEGETLIRSFSGDLIAECGPGSILGEISLIDDQPRSATVVAKGDCQVAILPSIAFRGIMDSDPRTAATVMTNLSKVLCRRLRAMNVQLDSIGLSG
ncbi:MAG: cyclic nucleotide-binding domain-containing protein [Fimbriimonadaceae bacterium]